MDLAVASGLEIVPLPDGAADGDVMKPFAANTPCDLLVGFAYVSLLAIGPNVLMLNPKFNDRSLQKLIALEEAEMD